MGQRFSPPYCVTCAIGKKVAVQVLHASYTNSAILKMLCGRRSAPSLARPCGPGLAFGHHIRPNVLAIKAPAEEAVLNIEMRLMSRPNFLGRKKVGDSR